MQQKNPKRDFIFIDESGDPGEATEYFIVGLLHLTDESMKKINIHLGAFRYFATIKKEMKSTRLTKMQKEQLCNILKLSLTENVFIRASVVYVRKDDYEGNYLFDKFGYSRDATKFRHFITRKLLEFHFKENKVQSDEIELVIDRFHSSEFKEKQLKKYLRSKEFERIPPLLHIIQADSRYVELLQVVDWITGTVKERFFVHSDRNFNGLFECIKVKKIIK